jgi:hypothetical protein
MIPPTTPTIATPILILDNAALFPTATTAAPTKTAISSKLAQHWQAAPLTSPDIKATPAPVKKIAQSELPGGSTPPTPSTPAPAPPAPSIRDTGSGYPTNIPRNYFGPAIGTGNGATGFGATSRFSIGDNYSVRPSALFGNNGTIVRVPVTYDFVFGDKEPFERNPLVTFHAGGGVQFSSGSNSNDSSKFGILGTIGVDVNLFENTALVVNYNTDFASINGVNFGLGFEF